MEKKLTGSWEEYYTAEDLRKELQEERERLSNPEPTPEPIPDLNPSITMIRVHGRCYGWVLPEPSKKD